MKHLYTIQNISKLFLSLMLLGFLCVNKAFAQTTYTWVGSSGGSWQTASNWSPAVVPPSGVSSFVVFDGFTGVVNDVNTRTVGKLEIINGSNVTLKSPTSANGSLTLGNGVDLTDFLVQAGCTLSICGRVDPNGSNTTLTLSASAGSLGQIFGVIQVTEDEPDFNSAGGSVALGAGSHTFESGSFFIVARDGGSVPTNPNFVTGSTVLISGTRKVGVSSLGGTFYDVVFNTPNLQAGVTNEVVGSTMTVNNDLKIENSGAGAVSLINGISSVSLNIKRNLVVGNGIQTANVASRNTTSFSGTMTLTVGNEIIVENGSILDFNRGTNALRFGEGSSLGSTIILNGTGQFLHNTGSGITSLNVLNTPVGHTFTVPFPLQVSSLTIAGILKFNASEDVSLLSTGTLSGAGTLDMSGVGRSHTLRLRGNSAIGTFLAGTSKVIYDSPSNSQMLSNVTYYDLEIGGNVSGTNTKTGIPADNPVTIQNSLTLTAGSATFGTGTVTLSDGATIYVADGILGGSGTVTSPGTFNLVYQPLVGGISKNIDREWPATAVVNNVTLNGKLLDNFILIASRSFGGILNLGGGKLVTNANTLTARSGASVVNTVFGNPSASYINIGGNGSFVKTGATSGALTGTYYVGSGTAYSPVIIDDVVVGASGPNAAITIRTQAVRHPVSRRAANHITRYWNLSLTDLTITSWEGSFMHRANEIVGTPNQIGFRAGGTGTTWTLNPNGSTYSVTDSSIIVPSGTTQFAGDWTAGTSGTSFDLTTGVILTAASNTWQTPATWVGGVIPGQGATVGVDIIVLHNITTGPTAVTELGNIGVDNGGICRVGGANFTVNGTVDIATGGQFVENTGTGVNTVSGLVRCAGVWSVNQAVTFGAGIEFNGTSFGHSGQFNPTGNPCVIGGGSSFTISGQIRLANGSEVLVTNSSPSGLTISNQILNVTGNTTGRFTLGEGAVVSFSGGTPGGISGADETDTTNYNFSALNSMVAYTGGAQTLIPSKYYNLFIIGSGTKTIGLVPSNHTIVKNELRISANQTLANNGTIQQYLHLGDENVNSAYLLGLQGTLNLNNGTNRGILVVRSSGQVFRNAPTGFTTTLGGVIINTSGIGQPAVNMPGSWTIHRDFEHVSNNNVKIDPSASNTFQGGVVQQIFGTSSGETAFGNLRIVTNNTHLQINRSINVEGNATGTNSAGTDAAFGLANTTGVTCTLGANVSLNFNPVSDGGTFVIGRNVVGAFNAGSNSTLLVNPQSISKNVRFIANGDNCFEFQHFTVGNGADVLMTNRARINGIFTNNGKFESTGTGLPMSFSYVPSPITQNTIIGTPVYTKFAKIQVAAGARINTDLPLEITERQFSNLSDGLGTPAISFKSTNLVHFSIGNSWTFEGASTAGRVVFNDLLVTGVNVKTWATYTIQVMNSFVHGPGSTFQSLSGNTEGVLIVGDENSPNSAYVENNGTFNFSNGTPGRITMIFKGTGDVFRGSASSSQSNIGVVNFDPVGSGLVYCSSGFTIADSLNLKSSNDATVVPDIRIATTKSSIIGGAGSGTLTLRRVSVGSGVSGINLSLKRNLTISDSLHINFNATGGFLDLGGNKLTLQGQYTTSNANNFFRGDDNTTLGTSEFHFLNSGNIGTTQLRFRDGFNCLNRFVHNRTANPITISGTAGQGVRIAGTSNPTLELVNGAITVSNAANSLLFAPTGATIERTNGTLSLAPSFTGVTSINYKYLANLTLGNETINSGTAINNVEVNAGTMADVVTTSVSRTINGTLTMTSGIFNIGANTLTLNGPIVRTGGVLRNTSGASLVLGGSSEQVLANGIFENDPVQFTNVTVNNSHASGVTMGNQGMQVLGNLTFGGSATSLKTPIDLDKFIDLGTTGTLVGEASNRYVVGRIKARRVAAAGSLNMAGLGAVISGITPATAGVMNSIGGSFELDRLAGIAAASASGNSSEGHSGNSSIRRRWSFSPVGALPDPGTITLSWTEQDDNLCPTCNVNSMALYRRANPSSDWIRITQFPFSYADADQGAGLRSLAGPATTFTEFSAGYEAEPLPVVLTNLAARWLNKDVLVSWGTASEKNTSHFEVQRSVDLKSWNVLGKVDASGFSSSPLRYSFLDDAAGRLFNNGAVYYRLRIVDFDGTAEISEPVAVDLSKEKGNLELEVRPNPFVDEMFVQFIAGGQETAKISVTDITGREVLNIEHKAKVGLNEVRLNLYGSDLKRGFYFVKLTYGDSQDVKKVVKRH